MSMLSNEKYTLERLLNLKKFINDPDSAQNLLSKIPFDNFHFLLASIKQRKYTYYPTNTSLSGDKTPLEFIKNKLESGLTLTYHCVGTSFYFKNKLFIESKKPLKFDAKHVPELINELRKLYDDNYDISFMARGDKFVVGLKKSNKLLVELMSNNGIILSESVAGDIDKLLDTKEFYDGDINDNVLNFSELINFYKSANDWESFKTVFNDKNLGGYTFSDTSWGMFSVRTDNDFIFNDLTLDIAVNKLKETLGDDYSFSINYNNNFTLNIKNSDKEIKLSKNEITFNDNAADEAYTIFKKFYKSLQ